MRLTIGKQLAHQGDVVVFSVDFCRNKRDHADGRFDLGWGQ